MVTKEETLIIVKSNEDKIHEIRQSIKNFANSIHAAVSDGRPIILGELYEKFKKMNPSIHRHCWDPKTIDLSALSYALQRLPDEITKAKVIYIKKEHENLDSVEGIKKIDSKARRRATYDEGNGNLKFISRDPETDIEDILTCLSMYGIEAAKIKEKLRKRPLPQIPIQADFSNNNSQNNQYLAELSNILNVSFQKIIESNKTLDFKLPYLLKNISDHDAEKMLIDFDSEFSRTDASVKAREWRKKIEKELEKYKGRPLAIISSDTHSVVNCITGFVRENKEKIIELASRYTELSSVSKEDPSYLYYFVQKLCKMPENNSLLKEKIDYEEKLGIRLIKDQFNTGIDVHIIDVEKILTQSPDKVDPRIKVNLEKIRGKGLVILNMDFSFGRQGIHSMRELCTTFGSQIQSISIIGKAGLTCNCGYGGRFDIMLPTHVVPQIGGGIYDLPTGNSLKKEDFTELISNIYIQNKDGFKRGLKVHNGGPMLTVPCVAMQSDLLHYYYIAMDNTIGVEMEAAPYLDAIEKSYKRGYLNKDFMLNVSYWASDMPLDPEESLAESHMDSGFLPLYAIILATLNKILNK
jgi:hypothetical protein